MKTVRIIADFMRMTDSALQKKATHIAAAMKNNAHFPNHNLLVEELNIAINQYTDALFTTQTRVRVNTSEKNSIKLKLQAILKNLASYVIAVAQDSRAILLSSGFTLSAEAVAPVVLNGIENFIVKPGDSSGQVLMAADEIKTVRYYSFYYAIAGSDNPVLHYVREAKAATTLTGLQPGKTYTFYLKAVISKKRFIQSASVTRMVD